MKIFIQSHKILPSRSQIALNQFSTRAATVKRQVKALVFPNDWSLPDSSGPLGSQRNVDPRDAPVGTLREKLLRLMTSLDTNVKRCAAELVFTLCDENRKCLLALNYRLLNGNLYPDVI